MSNLSYQRNANFAIIANFYMLNFSIYLYCIELQFIMNEKKTTIKIADNLEHLLYNTGLSKKDADRLFDLSPGSFSKYTNGVTYPKIETMVAITEHFKISLDDLVHGAILSDNHQLDQFVKENHPELYHNEKKQSISGGNIELDHLKELMKAKDDTIASLKMTNELLKNQLDDLKREIPKRLPRDNGSNNKAS